MAVRVRRAAPSGKRRGNPGDEGGATEAFTPRLAAGSGLMRLPGSTGRDQAGVKTAAWPEPYLQPDPREDCGYFTAAYIARCLGHPETTAEQVKAWRAETRKHETQYAKDVLGAEFRTHWTEYRDSPERKIFWLGPRARDWVHRWLEDGWIAAVCLHRIAEMGHAAAVLGCGSDGVQLMDPIYGHITEPWGWFLGPGPKAEAAEWPGGAPDGRPFYGCHFIEGWYKP